MIGDIHSLPDIARYGAQRFPDEPALVGGLYDGRRTISYARLAELVDKGASALCSAGLRAGECVVLIVGPRPEWIAALLAILRVGGVAVPLTAETPLEVVGLVAGHVQAKAVIADKETPPLAAVLNNIACVNVEGLFAGDGPSPTMPGIAAQDLALLAFTSGSTHAPHAVELTHANVLADLQALLTVRSAQPGDAFLSMLPPAHLFELVVGTLGPLMCGACIVYPGTLLPNRLIKIMRDEHITHVLAVPTLLDMLYQELLDELIESGMVVAGKRSQPLADTVQRLSMLSSTEIGRLRTAIRNRIGDTLHTLIVGGAAPAAEWVDLCAVIGLQFEVGYGLTEAAPIVSLGLASECPRGSAGKPLPGVQVKIDDQGEIRMRGANVMRGYYKDIAATRKALEGGWLHSGDAGRLDGQGFLYVTGRFKEAMVTASGETVYPEEIESYYESARFAELCVVPLTDATGNDMPILLVVPAAPDMGDEDIDAVVAELRAKAPARCRVHGVRRVAGPLPRTATGKIKRRVLADTMQRPEEEP